MTTPFSQTIVRDSFSRTNAPTLGANWTANSDTTTTGTLGIVSDAAQPSVGGNAASFYSAATFQPNQYSEVILKTNSLITNTHGGGPTVRGSSGGYYRLFINNNDVSGNVGLASVIGGVFTSLATATVTSASGDLIRLEIVGAVLTGYQNGTQIIQFTDTNITSGAPGICGFMATAPLTSSMVNWEGGDLIWTREGTVIAKTIGNGGGAQEPTVLYEANPVILSANADGKIWKMWYTNGWTNPVVINYAESNDGITWTQYTSNPVISDGSFNVLHGFVLHLGSTYYAYEGNDAGANNGTTPQLDLWTATDGVTFTLAHSAVLSVGSAGAWDHEEVDDPVVWVSGGMWYMLYQGRSSVLYSVGLATSSDGITWTKYASNPVITNGTGSALNDKNIVLDGNLYYLWGGTSPQGSGLPTDISMWSSPDLHTWTTCTKNPIYERVLIDEGPNAPTAGQVGDISLVELNGTVYGYYDAINDQASGQIHINMAKTPWTMLQLVGMIFGANIVAGNVGVTGATINYGTNSVTSDINGNFVIPILTNGSYTITPSLAGYTFSPTSSSQTVASSDITSINFTAAAGIPGALCMLGCGAT